MYIDENGTYVGKYNFYIGSVLFLILSVLGTEVLKNVLYLDYKICIFSELDLYLHTIGLAPLYMSYQSIAIILTCHMYEIFIISYTVLSNADVTRVNYMKIMTLTVTFAFCMCIGQIQTHSRRPMSRPNGRSMGRLL